MDPIVIDIPGIPQPGGSKRGFYIAKIKRVVITDACKKNGDWKQTCAFFARQCYTGQPLDMPLSVHFDFFFTRPKGHYRTGRNAGQIRESAPAFPAVKPDLSKTIRSTEDALTQIVWRDDSLIVRQFATKTYAERPGCRVTIRPMEILPAAPTTGATQR